MDTQNPETLKKINAMQVCVAALAAGCVSFMATAIVLKVLEIVPMLGEGWLISVCVMGATAIPIIVALALPRVLIKKHRQKFTSSTSDPTDFWLTGLSESSMVGAFVIESVVFGNLIAYLLEGWIGSLIWAIALTLFMLIRFFPTTARVEQFVSEQTDLAEQERHSGVA